MSGCYRPAHDLDTAGGQRIDRNRVISGCGGQIAGPLAILENKDPIAGQATDDRASGRGAN